MRRWLIIALLLIVPFQMVWAAAAPYCAHEAKSTAAAKHFGHHEHEHQGANSASGNGSSGIHLDCESCHLGCSVTLPAMGVDITPMPDHAIAISGVSPYASHVPSGPERPDRTNHLAAARFGGDVAFDPTTA